jgi:cytochrome c-type biogenesis protein CcmF
MKLLGRHILKPLVFSLVLLAVAAFWLKVTLWAALLGFWLVAFVGSVTLYEYGRAVLARRRATRENLLAALWHLAARNRRRYGGYIIHLGVIMMALGVIGIDMFQTQTQGTLKQGQSLQLDGYTITYNSLAVFDTNDNRNVARAVVSVSKDGRFLAELHPRRDYYYESQQPMTIPGLRTTLADDIYVILVDWQPISAQGATFKVYHNPLVLWMWLGGIVFILGTLVAAWPEPDPEAAIERVKRRATAPARA